MYRLRSASALAVIIAAASGTTCANAAFRVGGAAQIERDVSGSLSLGQTWNKKIIGDDVYQDEFIHTEAESKGQFILIDATTIELGPLATMKIDSAVFNPNGAVRALTASAEAGAMRWVSGTSMSSAYRINTPHVNIRVRGTTFDLLVEPQRTLVILQAGEIEVCSVDAPRRCKTLSRRGDTILAMSGTLVGPSRGEPSDFEARCLSPGPPCIISASLNGSPQPFSNPSRVDQRRADRTPRPATVAVSGGTTTAPPTPAIITPAGLPSTPSPGLPFTPPGTGTAPVVCPGGPPAVAPPPCQTKACDRAALDKKKSPKASPSTTKITLRGRSKADVVRLSNSGGGDGSHLKTGASSSKVSAPMSGSRDHIRSVNTSVAHVNVPTVNVPRINVPTPTIRIPGR